MISFNLMETKEILSDNNNINLSEIENKNRNNNQEEKENELSGKEENLMTFIRIRPPLKNENQAFKPVVVSENVN